MQKLSGMCSSNEHEACSSGRIRQQSGKKFQCACPCHVAALAAKVVRRREYEEDAEELDY